MRPPIQRAMSPILAMYTRTTSNCCKKTALCNASHTFHNRVKFSGLVVASHLASKFTMMVRMNGSNALRATSRVDHRHSAALTTQIPRKNPAAPWRPSILKCLQNSSTIERSLRKLTSALTLRMKSGKNIAPHKAVCTIKSQVWRHPRRWMAFGNKRPPTFCGLRAAGAPKYSYMAFKQSRTYGMKCSVPMSVVKDTTELQARRTIRGPNTKCNFQIKATSLPYMPRLRCNLFLTFTGVGY